MTGTVVDRVQAAKLESPSKPITTIFKTLGVSPSAYYSALKKAKGGGTAGKTAKAKGAGKIANNVATATAATPGASKVKRKVRQRKAAPAGKVAARNPRSAKASSGRSFSLQADNVMVLLGSPGQVRKFLETH